MTVHLPEDLQRYVHDQVLAGRFRSEDDVILDALARHRQAQQPSAKANAQPDLTSEEMADQDMQRRLLEAGIISGVEGAPDADQGEVRTRQVPEDDVPQEYLDED